MTFKRMLVVAAATAALLGAMTMPALAAGRSAPKATGGVGYSIYSSLERHADFSAIATSDTCSYADVTGSYVIDVTYLGVDYAEDLILAQTGTSITGTSLELVGGGSPFTISSGSVLVSAIAFDANYSGGSLQVHFTGSIAADGSMSGSWADVAPGTRTGTWATTSGHAAVVVGCSGKSTFNYSDANGTYYTMNVKYVNVVGNTASFAGQIVAGNTLIGSWLLVQVVDNGEPGKGVDQISGEVVANEAAAIAGVALMSQPADGPVTISSGNLQVH